MQIIARPFAKLILAGLLVLGCSSETTVTGDGGGTPSSGGHGAAGGDGGTGGSAGGGASSGGGGASGVPDDACMALCSHPTYDCVGVDLELGVGSPSEITAIGCTFTASLPASGTVVMALDCVNAEACVTTSDGGCAGNQGDCYPITVDGGAFSYAVPNCIQGSMSCNQVDL